MNSNNEFVKRTLRDAGYKYTSQRAEIYNVFLEHENEHLSTEEVYDYVAEKNPELGIATVYRTVMLFDELGVIYKINFDDGVVRYEIKKDGAAHRHHHLICVDCGKIIEVKIDLLDDLERQIEAREDFKIVDHSLKFYGHCKDCCEKIGEKDNSNEK